MSRLSTAPRRAALRTNPVSGERKQLSAGMAATLSAELAGRVPEELVAEIVQAVLYENRQATRDRDAEFPMLEARLRLERFIRARSAS